MGNAVNILGMGIGGGGELEAGIPDPRPTIGNTFRGTIDISCKGKGGYRD